MIARQVVSSLCITVSVVFGSVVAAAAQEPGGRAASPSELTPGEALRQRVAEVMSRMQQQENRARELERLQNQLQSGGLAVWSGAVGSPVAGSDPLTRPVVRNAPYSGDAITTVTQTLGDGTRIERSTTAKYYRDGGGRIRREQTIIGLDGLNPSREPQTVITITPDPDDAVAYQLDSATRTARRVGRGAGAFLSVNQLALGATAVSWYSAAGRGGPQPDAPRPVEEALGTRQFEGVNATGRRTTTTIPIGAIGNDRPIEIVDERWESAELGVLVYSRQSDPRTGIVEYRLTNITRSEPPPDLFVVPPDYTVVGGAPGARGAGAGGARGALPGARGAGGRGGRPAN